MTLIEVQENETPVDDDCQRRWWSWRGSGKYDGVGGSREPAMLGGEIREATVD